MSFPNWLYKDSFVSDFPLENLPFGIFSDAGKGPRAGVALGEYVIDLSILQTRGFFTGPLLCKQSCFSQDSLNEYMELGKEAWKEARSTLQCLLSDKEGSLRDNSALQKEVLIPMNSVQMHLPARIGDYTDFYASKEHATNIGILFRGPTAALNPNWVHLPVAYHGRSSSVIISGTDVHRPCLCLGSGQFKRPEDNSVVFEPSRKVDYELEMGLFIGTGNALGEPIKIGQAIDHAFGVVLLNDWSARDIQPWEAVPLGPFTSKNWATSISPWIVPMEALEPFQCSAPIQDPLVLPYLDAKPHLTGQAVVQIQPQAHVLDISTDGCTPYCHWVQSPSWRFVGDWDHKPVGRVIVFAAPIRSCVGCKEIGGYGCLLERSLHEPETAFLKDGDVVTLSGWCEKEDGVSIGFGKCEGRILSTK